MKTISQIILFFALCGIVVYANYRAIAEAPQEYWEEPATEYAKVLTPEPFEGQFFNPANVEDVYYYDNGPWVVVYTDPDAEIYEQEIHLTPGAYFDVLSCIEDCKGWVGDLAIDEASGNYKIVWDE